MISNDCIFCKIVGGKIPSHKIYEDEHVFAFLDISGDAEGHTLVIPKKHYENILDCPQEELNAVISAVKRISKHFTESCGFTGVNLLNNSGKDAHQSVFHLHFHIYPRKAGDGINLVPKLNNKDMDLKAIAEKLRF